nr:MAG TPA: hypothetical protein [Caudoviricetes sp.]
MLLPALPAPPPPTRNISTGCSLRDVNVPLLRSSITPSLRVT